MGKVQTGLMSDDGVKISIVALSAYFFSPLLGEKG